MQQSLQASVLEALRQDIWSGRYSPGDWLRPDTIAREFGISRVPVREAIRSLEAEGLVQLHPRRGAVVKKLTRAEIHELFTIRALLEREAAVRGAPHLTDDDLQELESALERMRTAQEVTEYLTANKDFHHTIYRASGWLHLLDLIDRLRINVERYLGLYLARLDHLDRRSQEHKRILEACKERNAEKAGVVTESHIVGSGASLLAFLEQAGLVD